METVFKLHNDSICSMDISDKFCVTGSKNNYLRIWPLSFNEFVLEAQFDGPVISLKFNKDTKYIFCGTANGSLGILDIE